MGAFGDYLEQLRESIRARLWYPALALALALPDVCADLEGIAGNYEQRVIKWLKQNRTYLAIQPEILYNLRCADVVRCLYEAAGPWAKAHQELLRQSEASGRLLVIQANPRNKLPPDEN